MLLFTYLYMKRIDYFYKFKLNCGYVNKFIEVLLSNFRNF